VKTPQEIVSTMMEKDAFSQWMNVEILQVEKGACLLRAVIHKDMLNGFEIAHGGISYALSDSALAFSSNAYGFKCVSIETSISHLRPVYEGDILTVKSEEIHRGKTIGIYTVEIQNQDASLISKFKGTVNISSEHW
jgi:acyl-CoA thioesterase